ncbi:MAG: DUF3575 domain-containing protein [Rikenellaceae bacterium]
MWRQNFLHLTRTLGILGSILICTNLYAQGSKPLKFIFDHTASKIDSILTEGNGRLSQFDSMLYAIYGKRYSYLELELQSQRLPIKALSTELKPLFAVKTNLLFDALTLINVEVEVPIKDRWSIAGEFIFPWWTWDNKQLDSRRHRIQLLNGTLEARYWLTSRADKEILTGWFAGLYGGAGVYDFEYDKKGYQGEVMIAAGISGGYAHTINKSKTLRMEYSLGVGLLRTKYRYYEVDCYYDNRWHPMKEREGIYTWIGPTRAKVSLSWLINYSKKY